MSGSHCVPISSLGTCTSHVLVFCPTRRDMGYKLTSALVCQGSIHGCLGRLMRVNGSSRLPVLNLDSVIGIEGGMPGSGDNGVMTICCTSKRVASCTNSSTSSRNVMNSGIDHSLHGLGSGSSIGTIILQIGSPNKDTFTSRRV